MATDDLESRQRRLERRQAMADALMAQSMQAPQGQMVSGHYVAPSPFEYLAKAGQQYLGNRSQRRLDEQQSGIDADRRNVMAEALQGYLANRQQDPYAAAAQGAASDSPIVQRLAIEELKELNKPETWKAGGTRRDPNTGELVEVLISNRGNERQSGYGSAPEMKVSGGEVYDPRSVQPGQRVGRDPGQMTPFQAEQLRMQQERLRAQLQSASIVPSADGTLMAVNPRDGTARAVTGEDGNPVKAQQKQPLNQKQMQNVKDKMQTLSVFEKQLENLKEAEKNLGFASEGIVAGRNPLSEAGRAYDGALAALMTTVRQLTRTPGEGAMSDYESRLSMAQLPSRAEFPDVRSQKISQLEDMLNVIRQGYSEMSGNEGAPSTKDSGDDSVPKAGEIIDGYRFVGGNPADQSSWELVK